LFEADALLWNNETVSNEITQEKFKSPSNELSTREPGNGSDLPRLAENPLSEREMEVATLLVTGASNNEIAEQLVISPHTVKVHLRNIYEKLAVSSRTEASMLLLQQGWMTLPGVEQAAPPVVAEAAPPDPEPLADTVGTPFAWQLPYLLGALLLVLGILLLPVISTPGATALSNLLSDGPSNVLAQPSINVMPRWESRTPLPTARSRFALVATDNGKLYAIGGEGADAVPFSAVDSYDLSVNEWKPVAALPSPLANLAAAVWGDEIFVAGGAMPAVEDSAARTLSRDLWRYTIPKDRWQLAGQLPLPLAGASLIATEDALYLLGGWDGQTMHAEIWRVALSAQMEAVAAGDWQVVTEMAVPRAFGGAVFVRDAIYVAGGYDGQRELAVTGRYLIESEKWEELPSLSTPRGGVQLLYDDLAVFAVGGGWTQPVNTIERFDPATGIWSHFPSPIEQEWRHLGAAASKNGYLYLIGGWSDSYLTTHLHYQSSFRTFLPATQNKDE
jgi:DNA-binding CsgD family transcriptional regulator